MKRIFLVITVLAVYSNLIAQVQTTINNSEIQREINIKSLPVLWHQTSAEYRALCYQAFNVAQSYLESILKTKTDKEKFAIITDLDETIIDNSFSEAQLIKAGIERTSSEWKKWVNKASATAVPGAQDFLLWAHKQGISIFYISNRDTSQVNITLENLKKLNLPNADPEHMLFYSKNPSKEDRRIFVARDYKVVMLMGDNLNDFTQFFEKKPIDERKYEVDLVKDFWGKKFIVLPNAIYGEWESAIYDYKKLTPNEKENARKEKLIGY